MRQLKITQKITQRDSLSLDKYLNEVGKISLINSEEEAVLAKKIRQGDQAALHKITKANLRFVISVAKQYQNQGLPLIDLINEGNVGLIKAAKRFDELCLLHLLEIGCRRSQEGIHLRTDTKN